LRICLQDHALPPLTLPSSLLTYRETPSLFVVAFLDRPALGASLACSYRTTRPPLDPSARVSGARRHLCPSNAPFAGIRFASDPIRVHAIALRRLLPPPYRNDRDRGPSPLTLCFHSGTLCTRVRPQGKKVRRAGVRHLYSPVFANDRPIAAFRYCGPSLYERPGNLTPAYQPSSALRTVLVVAVACPS
jgi:hypothetical protein